MPVPSASAQRNSLAKLPSTSAALVWGGPSKTYASSGNSPWRENVLLALPQHPGENLGRALLPPFLHRERDAADRRKADALLAEFFLAEVADQPASEISYGQQKLLTLACCAAMDASLLLLDEPVAGISPEYREHIAERLASLQAAGKAILLIEHQRDFLERTGDAFLFLQTGRLHRFDTLAELRAAPVAHDALN